MSQDNSKLYENGISSLEENSVRIKEIYIELPDYKYFHSPDAHDKTFHWFIGRERLIRKLQSIIFNSETQSGAYLVTGYRGMGKTSVVRRAINTYSPRKSNESKEKRLRFPYVILFWLVLSVCIVLPYLYFDSDYLNDIFTFLKNVLGPEKSVFELVLYSLLILIGAYLLITVIIFIPLDIKHLKKNYRKKAGKTNEIEYFEINLSQEEVKDEDLLRLIAKELWRYWDNFIKEVFTPNILNLRLWYGPIQIVYRVIRVHSEYRKRAPYAKVFRKLSSLNDRINAQVTSQDSLKISPGISYEDFFGLLKATIPFYNSEKNKQINYPLAGAKEIEAELIDILFEIDELRSKTKKDNSSHNIPKFLFIIDELDKIDPNVDYGLVEKEVSDPFFKFPDLDISTKKHRQRQEAVAKLLGNLKGFLNIARAKFIFIGGREMYDAALADIADRDSFYSSVFDDVLYVESFFKDEIKNGSTILQMTEALLHHLIVPKHFWDSTSEEKKYEFENLATVLSYIWDYHIEIDPSLGVSLQKNSYEKIALFLKNFAVFLAYRSNGTPKKLIALIENFTLPVYTKEIDNLRRHSLFIEAKHDPVNGKNQNSTKIFLRFGFKNQYEINFTSNIYKPYILAKNTHLKSLGDKILFSTSFMFDHILKFHPFGFSWRNLELIPEVILANKEPQLRSYIEEMLRYLSKSYIRESVSGIVQFKFYKKITLELQLISKISELGSAAFNFTLDESLSLKRHYKVKLNLLEKKYHNYQPIEGDNQFVHAICFIQTIIGDLHFYDKEFDDAIHYYSESIQTIRIPCGLEKTILTKHQFFIWVRNKLKLGLALEKIRAYDSALSIYDAVITKFTQASMGLADSSDHLNIIPSMQLISKPFIGKLGVIEKGRFDGITVSDLKNTMNSFSACLDKYFIKENNNVRKSFIKADYLNNVGGLLYYKNSFQSDISKEIGEIRHKVNADPIKNTGYNTRPSIHACRYYRQSLVELTNGYKITSGKSVVIKELELVDNILKILTPDEIVQLSAQKLNYIANVITRYGDSILASIYKDQSKTFDTKLLLYLSDTNHVFRDEQTLKTLKSFIEDIISKDNIFDINYICFLYFVASILYNRAGQTYSFAFQQKKILYLIKDVLFHYIPPSQASKNRATDVFTGKSKEVDSFIEKLEIICDGFYQRIYEAASWQIDNSDRSLIESALLSQTKSNAPQEYESINNSNDIKEVTILIDEIKLKLYRLSMPESEVFKNKFFKINSSLNPYSQINNMFLRALECKFYSHFLFVFANTVFKEVKLFSFLTDAEVKKLSDCFNEPANCQIKEFYGQKSFETSNIDSINNINFIFFLIKEGMFCCREVIRISSLFQTGYIVSNTYQAESFRSLAKWTLAWENFEKACKLLPSNDLPHFRKQLNDSFPVDFMENLNSLYFYKQSLSFYYTALEIHTEGRAYKEKIYNFHFLEDDYNDNLTHFSAAMERFKLNLGWLRHRISSIRKIINDLKVLESTDQI